MVKTTLKIDGMMCGMCESHVNDAIRNAFPVKKVTSSHSKGETVIISEEALSEDKIREVMQPTGYELKDITSEPYEKRAYSQESKPEKQRLCATASHCGTFSLSKNRLLKQHNGMYHRQCLKQFPPTRR